MKLRARLALTTLALMVPLVTAIAIAHGLVHGTDAFALAMAPGGSQAHPLPLAIHAVSIVLSLIAVVIGIGPIIRRTRELTVAVRRWQEGAAQALPVDRSLDELGELSRAFQGAAESVAARKRDLREFVENLSHDLATPLTVLQGHLASLAREPNADVVREAMNEAQYMGSLLGSLGIIAKFETGAIVDGTIDLTDLTTRVAERHRPLATRLHVSLEWAVPDLPVFVHGDMTFAEQALANLIGNALRHNRPDGHAVVVLDVVGDEFALRVLDDGPGLNEAERARVQKRGERGDRARSRDPDGRGLGLSIVARVAAVHGWSFSLGDNESQGLVAELRGTTRPEPGEGNVSPTRNLGAHDA